MRSVEKHSEAVSEVGEEEWSGPSVRSTKETGDGSVLAVPNPYPTPDLLIMKSSLPINGNSVPLTTRPKALLKSSFTVFSLCPTSKP